MTRSCIMPTILTLVLSAATGCGKRGGPDDTVGDPGAGTTGQARTTSCKLAGEWAGTLVVVEADGMRLPPELQIRVPADMRFSFSRTGAVTMSVGGRSSVFDRPGSEVLMIEPFAGASEQYRVLGLAATENRVELRVQQRSSHNTGPELHDPVHEQNGTSDWTFALNGDRLDIRCSARTVNANSGHRSCMVMTGVYGRAGGAGGW